MKSASCSLTGFSFLYLFTAAPGFRFNPSKKDGYRIIPAIRSNGPQNQDWFIKAKTAYLTELTRFGGGSDQPQTEDFLCRDPEYLIGNNAESSSLLRDRTKENFRL
jgi:hypothetical protein